MLIDAAAAAAAAAVELDVVAGVDLPTGRKPTRLARVDPTR